MHAGSGGDVAHRYATLADRILTCDQVGFGEAFNELARGTGAGGPAAEREPRRGVRIHAPFTDVPYHERIDDGYPNFVNNELNSACASSTMHAQVSAQGLDRDALPRRIDEAICSRQRTGVRARWAWSWVRAKRVVTPVTPAECCRLLCYKGNQ
ncbi:MAG TPA: hypothetical protein VL614_13215 [Acetobacteraceae bacterium]|nr:hypothetical protein [Acetobacteraceae bacterium]